MEVYKFIAEKIFELNGGCYCSRHIWLPKDTPQQLPERDNALLRITKNGDVQLLQLVAAIDSPLSIEGFQRSRMYLRSIPVLVNQSSPKTIQNIETWMTWMWIKKCEEVVMNSFLSPSYQKVSWHSHHMIYISKCPFRILRDRTHQHPMDSSGCKSHRSQNHRVFVPQFVSEVDLWLD